MHGCDNLVAPASLFLSFTDQCTFLFDRFEFNFWGASIHPE